MSAATGGSSSNVAGSEDCPESLIARAGVVGLTYGAADLVALSQEPGAVRRCQAGVWHALPGGSSRKRRQRTPVKELARGALRERLLREEDERRQRLADIDRQVRVMALDLFSSTKARHLMALSGWSARRRS